MAPGPGRVAVAFRRGLRTGRTVPVSRTTPGGRDDGLDRDDGRPAGPRPLPALFAGATVLAHILYPLAGAHGRTVLTVLSVICFCAASVTHAVARRGPRWAAAFVVLAASVGLIAETVGVRTGAPFGSYSYTGRLGPRLAGVPALVPLAWTMMAYPAYVFAVHARGANAASAGPALAGRARLAVTGGVVLTAWDLFLDPQMVAAGYWHWAGGSPALNGIPVSNIGGWLLVGTALTGLLTLPASPAVPATADRLPLALLAWTFASSLLANLAFFGRPGVALAGGLGVGLIALVAVAAPQPRGEGRA